MNRIAGAAAVSAVILAGCGTGAPAGQGSSPATCEQQFKAWQDSPAKATADQIKTTLGQVQAAAKILDVPQMNTGLKNAGKIARQLAAYPMPSCADPAGYWTQILGYLKAAGDNASTSSGLGAFLLAMAPLSKIPAVQANLTAELARNAGVTSTTGIFSG